MIKLIAHFLALIPFFWLCFAAYNRNLGADPQTKIMHEFGIYGLIFLLLSLTVSPAKKWFGYHFLVKYRRMLGLYSAWYLLLHLVTFIAFYLSFSLAELGGEIIERPYITVGFLGLLLMLPLVATSNRAAQRKLGKNWKKLHRASYFILGLGILHFIWQSKSDLNEPFIYLTWAAVILLARVIPKNSIKS